MFSFARERKRQQMQALLRRLADLTSPSLPPPGDSLRQYSRQNRCLPVLLAPCQDDKAALDRAVNGLTKDVCDLGISVVLSQPYQPAPVVVALWLHSPHQRPGTPEPYYLHGRVQHVTELGGGFWQVGVDLQELVTSQRIIRTLQPRMLELLPASVAAPLQPTG